MTPVDEFPEQERAFHLLHTAIAGTTINTEFPSAGACSNKAVKIFWSWNRDEKSKSNKPEFVVQENRFRRSGQQSITISVPLGQRDINNAGLVARDAAGKLHLCRQRFGDYIVDHRVQDALIADEWTGSKYRAFVVPDPSPTTQSRLYFACVPLEEGPSQLLGNLGQLLDSYAVWSQNRLPRRTQAQAVTEMSAFYQASKLSLPKEITSQRKNIITLLMKGLSAEDAFKEATEALVKNCTHT